jgi:hypothetical protein
MDTWELPCSTERPCRTAEIIWALLFEQRIRSDVPLQPRCGVHLPNAVLTQTGGYIILARDIRPDCHGWHCCVSIFVSPRDPWHHHPHRAPTLGRHAGMRHSHTASCHLHLQRHGSVFTEYALSAFRYVWIGRSKTHTHTHTQDVCSRDSIQHQTSSFEGHLDVLARDVARH